MPPDTVSVIIATYGDREYWIPLSARADASATNQTRKPDEIIRIHGETLHGARNLAASKASTDWLCFLDGDDELEPDYLEAMLNGQGDLRYPRVRYVPPTVGPQAYPDPVILPKHHLLAGNYMVIGTLVRRAQFLRVEGFDPWPVLEDWALWIKCWTDGAESNLIPRAVYRAHMRSRSRNSVEDIHITFEQIVSKYKPLARAKGLEIPDNMGSEE